MSNQTAKSLSEAFNQMATTKPKETDLYQPVKTLLEKQGYEVKGEVGAADIVACRGDEDPVIVELKTGFTLALINQAIDRLSITDHVYVAVPRISGRSFLKTMNSHKRLCRRLGLGLITVRLKDGFADIHCDPEPYKPRQSKPKKTRLLREFSRRVGDPNQGGMTRKTIITAYRQDAMRCLDHLQHNGPTKASIVAKATAVENARALMARDHYGWFERVDPGIYAVTPVGKKAFLDNQAEIQRLLDHKGG